MTDSNFSIAEWLFNWISHTHTHTHTHTHLPGDDSDLGDGGLSKGVEQLGAVPYDAAVLLGRAGQETGDVHKGDDGDIKRITEANKASAFH